MPIGPLIDWKIAFDDLPLALTGPEGIQNLADAIASQVDGLLELAPPVFQLITYTWQKALFVTSLLSLAPSADPAAPRIQMAQAWGTATTASIPVPGAPGYVGAPAPPTQWGPPPVITVNPALVAAAVAVLTADLVAAPLAPGPLTSTVPDAFYKAFLSIGFILTGANTIPPPGGPLPLVSPATVL